jgi:cardiolipin synthase (CMP-forming)
MTATSPVQDDPGGIEPRDEGYRKWIFTIPNIICMVRIAGSVAMLAVAWYGWRYWFAGLFVALTLSDWIDGRLARWLRQRSDFGARLDSFADSLLYGALVLGVLVLCQVALQHELPWIAIAVISYVVTSGAGLIKYGKIPSYHTIAAKKSQSIVLLAGILLVFEVAAWPVRIAAIAVTLTNIEATWLTLILPKWQADVPSLWSVWQARRAEKSNHMK